MKTRKELEKKVRDLQREFKKAEGRNRKYLANDITVAVEELNLHCQIYQLRGERIKKEDK